MFSKLKNLTEKGEASSSKPDDDCEESLTTILPTHEDRTNLLVLIADLTEAMRGQILDTFDANKNETGIPLKLGRASDQPEEDADMLVKEKHEEVVVEAKGPQEAAGKQGDAEAEAGDAGEDDKRDEKAKKALEKRAREIAKPENVELKEAALSHFDEWRDKVMQRVGEAVNQRETEDDGTRPSSSSQERADAAFEGQESLQQIFTPLKTPLRTLNDARRILIMHSILLILLGLESYPAEARVLMLRLASSLGLSMELLAQDEMAVAKGLLEVAKQHMNADDETEKKKADNSTARKWKVGLGAVAGAVLIGVTGGLAAPLLAAGVGTVMGGLGLGATATAGYLGALAGSAPLVGVLFGAYGGKMTGKMVDEYAKEVEDFAFVPINKPSLMQRAKRDDKNARHLRVAVGISGWLSEESEVVLPWKVISGHSTEAFALRWELKALLRLGHALTTYIKSYAWGFAKKEIISRTVFAALTSALTLPYALAKATRVVDNPFSVAVSRSEKAGKVLADALINKVQGERPVTLMGYSLGARVIYSCLNELADRKAFGLIESVCLMGAPVPSDPLAWRRIRSVVAGRVINVYSTNDYLLAFLYRANSLQYGIAGLQPIRDVQAVENVDVSELVDGHTQYRFLVGSILQKLNLEDIDSEAVVRQTRKLKRQEQEDKEQRKRKEAEGKTAEEAADELEKEVEQKSKETQATQLAGSEMHARAEQNEEFVGGQEEMTEQDKLQDAEKR